MLRLATKWRYLASLFIFGRQCLAKPDFPISFFTRQSGESRCDCRQALRSHKRREIWGKSGKTGGVNPSQIGRDSWEIEENLSAHPAKIPVNLARVRGFYWVRGKSGPQPSKPDTRLVPSSVIVQRAWRIPLLSYVFLSPPWRNR